jgi:hypothetical protein
MKFCRQMHFDRNKTEIWDFISKKRSWYINNSTLIKKNMGTKYLATRTENEVRCTERVKTSWCNHIIAATITNVWVYFRKSLQIPKGTMNWKRTDSTTTRRKGTICKTVVDKTPPSNTDPRCFRKELQLIPTPLLAAIVLLASVLVWLLIKIILSTITF